VHICNAFANPAVVFLMDVRDFMVGSNVGPTDHHARAAKNALAVANSTCRDVTVMHRSGHGAGYYLMKTAGAYYPDLIGVPGRRPEQRDGRRGGPWRS